MRIILTLVALLAVANGHYTIDVIFQGPNCDPHQSTMWAADRIEDTKCDPGFGSICNNIGTISIWSKCINSISEVPFRLVVRESYDCNDCKCHPSIFAGSPTCTNLSGKGVTNNCVGGNVNVTIWNNPRCDGLSDASKMIGLECMNLNGVSSKTYCIN